MTTKVSLESIKTLRDTTGASIGDVRSALEAAGGDEHKAKEILRQKGVESAQKRKDRATSAGRVEAYIHHDGRMGALVEINCETDFVARTSEFQQFCRDVGMQVASQQPACLAKEQLPSERIEDGRKIGRSVDEVARECCLLEQPFIKDAKQTIGQLLTALIAKTGENIMISRFVRFGLGESSAGRTKD